MLVDGDTRKISLGYLTVDCSLHLPTSSFCECDFLEKQCFSETEPVVLAWQTPCNRKKDIVLCGLWFCLVLFCFGLFFCLLWLVFFFYFFL